VVSLDFVTWATVIGTWVLVVGTLAFAYWQLRQAQRLHSATTLLDLRERYYSARMRVARHDLASWLLNPDRRDDFQNWEVGVFFELMGYLTRSGTLERRGVWSAFGSWIEAYYLFLTQPVNWFETWRKESSDPLLFRDFEWLAIEMLEIDQRGTGVPGARATTLADARTTLEYEANLSAGTGATLFAADE